MGNLTERDKAASDLRPLLSLSTPRTDTREILPPIAINPNPLDCEDDDDETGVILRTKLAR